VLVQAPEFLCSVIDGHPAVFVEAFGLFRAAEEKRQGEFSIVAVLWHVYEVYQGEFFVQTPCPEVSGVDISCSYPDFHG
jgi:hypothetical protein